MFEIFGYIFKAFVYLWIGVIGAIPNAFMGGLTICVVATVITYFAKKQA